MLVHQSLILNIVKKSHCTVESRPCCRLFVHPSPGPVRIPRLLKVVQWKAGCISQLRAAGVEARVVRVLHAARRWLRRQQTHHRIRLEWPAQILWEI